jgi:hypothetical protein
VGEQIQFEIQVENHGEVSATGLLIKVRFDDGLEYTGLQSPIEKEMADLLPGRGDRVGATFRVAQPGRLCVDVEVTGEIAVKLWASSSAVDTDFTAKLIDVYPPSPDFPGGFDLNIGDGIVRARFRESLNEETLMEPGTVYPFTIKLYPTSNVFKKGHRIRVDVSSSNFPRFDLNPNTGEPLGNHRRTVTAVNTVYHDREHPSHIRLPVIPGE